MNSTNLTNTDQEKDSIAVWESLLPTIPAPSTHQFRVWLAQHSPEVIRQGLALAAVKNLRLNNTMDAGFAIRFASSIMNRLTQENKGATQ